MHEVLVNRFVELAQEKVCLYMAIAVRAVMIRHNHIAISRTPDQGPISSIKLVRYILNCAYVVF